MNTPNKIKPTICLNCRGRLVVFNRPAIMGILNVTPDSFFDGGRYNHVDNAVEQAGKMLAEGAGMIDIGGYSSRPGATDIQENEERDRVVPVIQKLREAYPGCILSVDTFRAKVAEAAIQAGADIINDISAGDDDAGMIPLVARLQVPYIIMHKQGTPQTMQQKPQYEDVVREVVDYLVAKVAQLRSLHVHDIIIDPGFGFGKTVEHNYQLLKYLDVFKIMDVPVLAGLSRKSLVNKVLGVKAKDALNGTTVLNTIALQNGAAILRVHDVKEAAEAVKLVEYYNLIS